MTDTSKHTGHPMSATYNNCDRRLGNGYCNLSKGHSGTCNIVPMARPKAKQASEGARELAKKVVDATMHVSVTRLMESRAAALIDAELRELLPFLKHMELCEVKQFDGDVECTCGLAALLRKWQPGVTPESHKGE